METGSGYNKHEKGMWIKKQLLELMQKDGGWMTINKINDLLIEECQYSPHSVASLTNHPVIKLVKEGRVETQPYVNGRRGYYWYRAYPGEVSP